MRRSKQAPPDTRATLDLLYHISRELAADLDLGTVLSRVLFLSIKNVGAASGSIIVLDDQGRPVNSAIIHGGEVFDETTERLRFSLDEGLAGWVMRHREAALVTDTAKDDRWTAREYSKSSKYESRSSVSAPLLVRDQLVGIITLSHSKRGFFTNEHLQLVQAIADQAGIAVLNGRLYDESRRTARIMSAIAESSAAINASLEFEQVAQTILEQVSNALESEAASLAFIDPGSAELEFRFTTGKSASKVIGQRVQVGQGVAGWVAQRGQSALVPDVNADPRFFPDVDKRTGFRTRSIACAPIRSKDMVIGVIEALNLPNPHDADILSVLEGIGSLAGAAIDHARLFTQVETEHQRYLELFEASIDPIIISDLEGRIVEANRQVPAFTGYTREALAAMNVHHFHQVNWNVVGQDFENLSGSDPLSYQSVLNTEAGAEIQVEVHIRLVQFEQDQRLQWIFRDITERLELDQMREDFTAMIYHDLRSPLANVTSGLDVLASILPPDADPAFKSVLDIATRSTERVNRLAGALLDTSRLEAGHRISSTQPTPPEDLASEAIEIVTAMAKHRSHTLEPDLPRKLPKVRVDPDMIKRVLVNLLENAVKFTPESGLITLRARQKGNWLEFCVQDSGPGIPADEQQTIFEKFNRGSAKGACSPKGLGIGLAFCKLAVEAHGGEIGVSSSSGEGSTFYFTLPLA